MQLYHKTLRGIANSIDPDQTTPSGAVWFESILFAYDILSAIFVYEILGYLPYYWESSGYGHSNENVHLEVAIMEIGMYFQLPLFPQLRVVSHFHLDQI